MDEVGCRKCGKGGYSWLIYSDGKGKFKAQHPCGHVSDFAVVGKPDPLTGAIELRFLV